MVSTGCGQLDFGVFLTRLFGPVCIRRRHIGPPEGGGIPTPRHTIRGADGALRAKREGWGTRKFFNRRTLGRLAFDAHLFGCDRRHESGATNSAAFPPPATPSGAQTARFAQTGHTDFGCPCSGRL
jgi:hypothetical protein